MIVDSALLPALLKEIFGSLYAFFRWTALRLVPWGRIGAPERVHVYFGTILVLLFLWHLQVEIEPGLRFHLLGVTAFTLMVGWSLAVLGTSLALLAVTFNTGGDWYAFPLNALLNGVIPVSLTQILLILIRWYLPKHFFVFVLINGFLTAGLVGMFTAYLTAGLLVATGAYSFSGLSQNFLPLFPLMFLPEAIFNGWVVVVLVAYRPQWIYSFSDEQYLKGK